MTTSTKTTRPAKSERTCAGCGEKDAPTAFVRLVLVPPTAAQPAEVVVDAARGSFGRGAHVHPRPDCIEKACRGGLSRAFKAQVKASANELTEAVADALDRRVEGLLLAARRTGSAAWGTDAALEALAQDAALLVVACDAGSIATRREVQAAVEGGRAVAWGSKTRLGAAGARQADVALVAVTSASIAEEMMRASSGASACRAAARSKTRGVEHVSEVR